MVRLPVATTKRRALMRLPPASTVAGSMKRPWALMTVQPRPRKRASESWWAMAAMTEWMWSWTAPKSTATSPAVTPKAPACRAAWAAWVAASRDLDGTQPVFRQSPPMRSPSIRTVLAPICAAPAAMDIRWSICEAELIQAIGRGRGVNRTSETSLEVDLLTDVVLPVTIDTVLSWDEARPSRADIMAAHGVMLDNAAERARCFPDLWPSADAVRQDRSRSVTFRYYRNISNSQMSHSSVTVTYQPAGAGQKPRRAMFDLEVIRDPRAWLEQHLGKLIRWDAE
ncbi:MAG: hypothetical protein HQL42_12075 [Alphaproteobacteria bacterium]|nr:hypothetical protein [Alphaproteobacteria bacterium]